MAEDDPTEPGEGGEFKALTQSSSSAGDSRQDSRSPSPFPSALSESFSGSAPDVAGLAEGTEAVSPTSSAADDTGEAKPKTARVGAAKTPTKGSGSNELGSDSEKSTSVRPQPLSLSFLSCFVTVWVTNLVFVLFFAVTYSCMTWNGSTNAPHSRKLRLFSRSLKLQKKVTTWALHCWPNLEKRISAKWIKQ